MTQRISTSRLLKQAFSRLPVTCLMITVSCVLYSQSIVVWMSGDAAHVDKPGALGIMKMTYWPSINGTISLWKGDWWRLTVSAFHHGSVLHLVMNVLVFWMLAGLVEPKLGKLRYLAFCLVAATFSILPEAAFEQSAVGLSGLIYALFGILLVIRRHDEAIAAKMPPLLVPLFFGWLILCIPLTMFDILRIANGAHLFGVVYGVAVGWVCYDLRLRNRPAGYAGLTVIHLCLIAGLLALMQPSWNGRYVAWRAIDQGGGTVADWQKAVELEPSLDVGWLFLTRHALGKGELHEAWVSALRGARMNRSNEEFDVLARRIWVSFKTEDEVNTALHELQQVFGDEGDAWIERFGLTVDTPKTPTELVDLKFPDMPDQDALEFGEFLDIPSEVPGITRPLPPLLPPADVKPDHPNSANLGESL